MKKNLLATLLVLLTGSYSISAQNADTVLARVYYQFIHVNDTNNRDNPVKEEMVLRLGRHSSRYRNSVLDQVKKKKTKEEEEAAASAAMPMRVAAGMPMAVVKGMGFSDEEYLQLLNEDKYITTASLGTQQYMIESALPKIDWKIAANETKTIGGYTCQKATGDYAGRTYTAWFAPDLPFRNGPWKLSGLPGLIMEAKDSKNEVMFLFKEIYKEELDETTAAGRTRTIKISEDAYLRAKKAYDEDPVAGMQAQLSPSAPPVKVAYRDASGKATTGDEALALIEKNKAALKRVNNPLELKKP
ncbi:GLPGLI family protein [Sediminibacterium ginsengisoli]|uniref:GLPGLI family protein n=1 Tax=Sediminibacterium ginsengisoli TaxID=413434 RepID=A0A1T4R1W6_9BACT|nr:GLPGLI family protein [Sediminibacterium ginsengisoli]SKA10052.1 GLPGLI family protein [Sediminibacterium ginsengisoli]